MRKILTLIAALSLVASLAVGGSIAYLQDTDSAKNTMTLGNIYIEQHEYQRAEGVEYNAGDSGKGNGVKKGALVPFEQNKPLYPAVPKSNDAYTAEMNTTDLFYWGEYVSSGTAGNGLWNEKELANVVDKFVFVENTGSSDAYYRTVIAFECPEGMDYSEGSDKEFMMNVNGSESFEWSDAIYTTIGGTRYLITAATYQKALEAGKTSIPSLLQVVMTHNATNEDMELLGDTYEILVVSQAVQTAGFESAEDALNTAFGEISEENNDEVVGWFENILGIVKISTIEEMVNELKAAGAAGAGDTTLSLKNDIVMTEDWTPIKVDGYHGADIVTIDGNGHTITGLTAPLFAGGFAGGSGIVIKNLTIADSNIVSSNTLGSGAFIESIDSMETITLENVHLRGSSVTGSRTGGLIGWNSGWDKVNDGPVDTKVTIKNCSVADSTITGSAVGGIIGHAGANAATFNTIENCTVTNCNLKSTDTGDWRVGVVVGTANIGQVTINNITESGNTLEQTGKTAPTGEKRHLYGRTVFGDTGSLTIDGVSIQ